MALSIQRKGFGQVELNQVAGGMVTAQLVDQVPADSTLGAILEQGRFVRQAIKKADNSVVLVAPGASTDAYDMFGPFLMIYNEEYFYDERDSYHKDFAMKAEDFIGEEMVPRCFRLVDTDKLTTNCFAAANTDKNATVTTAISLSVGDEVGVGADGYLVATANAVADSPKLVVIKEYNLPDMQAAVKLQVAE